MQNRRAESAESSTNLYCPINNRRRRVRQKVHLPAQAIPSGKSSGKTNEPSEILDLSEDGACIRTSLPLRPESRLTLSLDLLETNSFVATSAVVIWSDQQGRNGIYFDGISDPSRQQIKQWLFTHAAAAGTSPQHVNAPDELGPRPVRMYSPHSESKRESARREFVKQSPEQTRAAIATSNKQPEPTTPTDYSSVLSALVAVKREVETIGSDLGTALQLLAGRALSLTHASGSAIALSEDRAEVEMICKARAGSDAPGLGARLQIGSGFSGECVRTGKTLRCDDAEADPRVDREGCRSLGIRSIIASPVRRRNDSVVGLLEVFSPNQHSFGPNEEKIIERLAEMIAGSMDRVEQKPIPLTAEPASAVAPSTAPRLERLESPLHLEQFLEPPPSPLRRFALAAIGIALVVGLVWLIVVGTTNKNLSNPSQARPSGQQNSTRIQRSAISKSTDFESLHKLAVDGDPDAQFDLGARYAIGEDVKQDYAESVRWFTKAAEQGHVIAQATLGAYYWAGRGIPQDLGKAYLWSAIAQAGGDEASRYRVTVLATRMPHGEVVAAQRQADDWLKVHKISGKTPE